jgi:hypothetical protein
VLILLLMSKITKWLSLWWTYYFILNWILIPNGFSNRQGKLINTIVTVIFSFIVVIIYRLNINIKKILTVLIGLFALLLIINEAFLPLHIYLNSNNHNFIFRSVSPVFPLTAQIIFQQLMIFLLVKRVFSKSDHPLIYPALLFMVSHFPIFFITRLAIWEKLWISGMSFAAGLVFSYLNSKFKKGYILSFLIHFTYYLILALLTQETDQFIP